MSNLEQEADRLFESLADALTTAVNVFTFIENIKLAKSNKTWFDKDVKKNIIRRNFCLPDTTDIALRLTKLTTRKSEMASANSCRRRNENTLILEYLLRILRIYI